MMQWILRTIASLFLGVLVLCSAILLFSTFVVTTVIRDDIYADALAEERAYSRLYSEVLTSQLVTDIRRKYILELALLPPEDIVDFVRDTAPPEYLQEQTESNLHRLSAYLKGESRQLHFYLDLSEPLERIPATLADLIEARAAESSKLLIHRANPIAADVTGQELAADIVTDLETLLDGGNPSRAVAEFTGKSREELLTIVDQALDEILANPDVPIAYRQALGDARPKLQSSFADDRSGDFLEVAIGVLVQPAVAAIVAGVDVELDDGNKLDLIPLLSQQVSDANGPTIQNTLGGWRDSATTAIFWGAHSGLDHAFGRGGPDGTGTSGKTQAAGPVDGLGAGNKRRTSAGRNSSGPVAGPWRRASGHRSVVDRYAALGAGVGSPGRRRGRTGA